MSCSRSLQRATLQICASGVFAATLAAQAGTATVRGVAFDSLHGRPLGNAFVSIVEARLSTTTDSLGRFSIDSVRPGTYRIAIQHDLIDALGLGAVGKSVTVSAGSASVVVAVPSFETLWRAACGTTPPRADSGFVFGSARNSGRPVAGSSKITASWVDLDLNRSSGLQQKGWKMETETDATGNYTLCGLPTSTGISVRASDDSSDSGWMDVPPLGATRIGRRDLELGPRATAAGAPAATSSLRGRVLADSARTAMAGASVELPELGLTTTSGADGQFAINGIIAGTHLVTVKRIGYAPVDQRLEFRPAATTNHEVLLERITTLDSVAVTARVGPRDEGMRVFAENQKRGFGTFITRAELEKRHGQKLGSVMAQVGGLHLARGHGGQAWVVGKPQPQRPRCLSTAIPPRGQIRDARMEACARASGFYLPDMGEAAQGMPTACYALVFIDRAPANMTREPFDLNTVPIDQIEAIEWYRGGTSAAPIEYLRFRANCGVLVLHTRRHIAK